MKQKDSGTASIFTNSDLNVLSQTRIQYAGQSNQPGIPAASIHIGENYVSKLKITQSTIAHGEGYGIAIDTNLATINSDFETVNQFEDLTLGAIKLHLNSTLPV